MITSRLTLLFCEILPRKQRIQQKPSKTQRKWPNVSRIGDKLELLTLKARKNKSNKFMNLKEYLLILDQSSTYLLISLSNWMVSKRSCSLSKSPKKLKTTRSFIFVEACLQQYSCTEVVSTLSKRRLENTSRNSLSYPPLMSS